MCRFEEREIPPYLLYLPHGEAWEINGASFEKQNLTHTSSTCLNMATKRIQSTDLEGSCTGCLGNH